jgi:CHASE2 domain-containing sensor protein
MAFLGFASALFLLIGVGRWAWSPMVFPVWAFVVSVYILIANFRTEPTVKATA